MKVLLNGLQRYGVLRNTPEGTPKSVQRPGRGIMGARLSIGGSCLFSCERF